MRTEKQKLAHSKANKRWYEKHREEILARYRENQKAICEKRRQQYHSDSKYRKAARQRRLNTPEVQRRANLKWKYGITEVEYEQMFTVQNSVCAICGRKSENLLTVDHDHTTGIIRGLLCKACNTGLGYFHDDPDSLRKAASYLEKTGSFAGLQKTEPCGITRVEKSPKGGNP